MDYIHTPRTTTDSQAEGRLKNSISIRKKKRKVLKDYLKKYH